MKRILSVLCAALLVVATGAAAVYGADGKDGLNAIIRRTGNFWKTSGGASGLSPSMKLALSKPDLVTAPGKLRWQEIAPGFQVSELSVLADGREVDRIELARIDPVLFRFEVRHRPSLDKDLQGWMRSLGAALIINGSYFFDSGAPVAPLLSAGELSGPATYAATHGAFVVSGSSVNVRDLAGTTWNRAFEGADHAMVSYPMLVGSNGQSRSPASSRLASRSFVAEDVDGHIVLGTTVDAFFSLGAFGDFLRRSPLKLRTALNLDGGSLACQGISLGGFTRDRCGRLETRHVDGRLEVVAPASGRKRSAMPIVLAVFPK